MAAADREACARILFAISSNWSAADGNSTVLAAARVALASMIYTDRTGFPQPDAARPIGDKHDAWAACLQAAEVAASNDSTAILDGQYAVLWPAKSGGGGPAEGLPMKWPYRPTSRIARSIGPISDGSGQPKELFIYDSVDEQSALLSDPDNSGRGFWPRKAGPSKAAAPPAPPVGGTQKRVAMALFVLWALAFVYIFLGQWVLSDVAQRTWKSFEINIAALPPASPAKNCTTLKAGKEALNWSSACDKLWLAAWNAQDPTQADKKARSMLAAANGTFYNVIYEAFWPKQPASIMTSFVQGILATFLLVIAAGLALKGVWFGALIDERNRLSLSRVQQICWMVLLLSAMAIACSFNACLIGSSVSPTLELFPAVPYALWAALGINLIVTPFLSSTVLDEKKNKAESARAGQLTPVSTLITPAELDAKASPHDASWLDLMTGETAGTENQLDVSRIQHVVISGLLISIYFILLAKMFAGMNSEAIATAFETGQVPIANFPFVSDTFVWLLGLSHAGYLMFKAKKPQGGGSAAASAGQRTPPAK